MYWQTCYGGLIHAHHFARGRKFASKTRFNFGTDISHSDKSRREYEKLFWLAMLPYHHATRTLTKQLALLEWLRTLPCVWLRNKNTGRWRRYRTDPQLGQNSKSKAGICHCPALVSANNRVVCNSKVARPYPSTSDTEPSNRKWKRTLVERLQFSKSRPCISDAICTIIDLSNYSQC